MRPATGSTQAKQNSVGQDHHCVFPAKIGPCPIQYKNKTNNNESEDKQVEERTTGDSISDIMFFSTKLFMIRYQEEEVELNDIGHFRVEMPLDN